VRELREDTSYIYCSWRDWVHREEKKQLLRDLRWMKAVLVLGTVLGTYAVVTANEVVELVLGIGILVGPAVTIGFYVWFAWKALGATRAERKAGWRPPS
jgi:hypothetical protein